MNSIPVIIIINNHVKRKIRAAFFILILSFVFIAGKKQNALKPKPVKQIRVFKTVNITRATNWGIT
jgi:hypothetical protein